MNPLAELGRYGQSAWLDFIRRALLDSGELARRVREDRLNGVTSNPAIFEKAIAGSTEYATDLAQLAARGDLDAKGIYEHIAMEDVRRAADVLREVFDATGGRDGYVSLEVSPHLSHDTDGTIAEARRLWATVARDNLMIKVPATVEGLPAIETLLAEGINVNVTLLFSVAMYREVAERYLRALERRAERGEDVARVASVASFFVSRVDSAVDAAIDARLSREPELAEAAQLTSLRGKAAVANAKLSYRDYQGLFSGARWERLAQRGARTQRLLWASTGTKNPSYRDVVYVEELIGKDTVNTLPPATADAFRDHGRCRASLTEDVAQAEATLREIAEAGIPMDAITDKLLVEGLQLFEEAFDRLLAAVAAAIPRTPKRRSDLPRLMLPVEINRAVETALEDWTTHGKVARLWARDASLWTGADEARWLDWMEIRREAGPELARLASECAGSARRFDQVVLIGMGGSSLAPEVYARVIGHAPDHARLVVADSTDPAQIRAIRAGIDPARALFVVSSKSGGTLEPNILFDYFHAETAKLVGAGKASAHFIAVTDPGSPFEKRAQEAGFGAVFRGRPGIGGRYSALSPFGMVPAALIGIDTTRILRSAEAMAEHCSAASPPRVNPGVMLGLVLGCCQQAGRDKLTLVTPPPLAPFGAWLEQLIAESTGKQGRAIIPVDGEPAGPTEVYGHDRVFVQLRLAGAPEAKQDARMEVLRQAGHAVIQIDLTDVHDLGGEMFRWEIATAVAGSVMGIHPFDQPDVEASKIETRRLTSDWESKGRFPEETPLATCDGFRLYTDAANARALLAACAGDESAPALLAAHFRRVGPGDYVALLAYLNQHDGGHESVLGMMRKTLRNRLKVATCLGFGPRFLHSTGQAYKGGPASGVFLQFTCEEADELPVPGHRFGFGVVKAAQALGDFNVLAERGRRALRVHLSADTHAALASFEAVVNAALKRLDATAAAGQDDSSQPAIGC